MNIIDFVNEKMSSTEERERIINRLKHIEDVIEGTTCFEDSLRPGKASSFLIYNLVEYFEKLNKKLENYLEIGVLYGGSLCALADSGFSGNAFGFDIYQGYYGDFLKDYVDGYEKNSESHMQIVKNNVKKIKDINLNLKKINSQDYKSTEEIKDFFLPKLQVLYIDGDHTYQGAISDFYLYNEFLEQGGLILMDNFEMRGVSMAVDEIKKNRSDYEEVGVWNNTTWIGIKK